MHPNDVVALTLTRGRSRNRGFTLGADCERALFRIGSGAECNWRVFGPGIAPHHIMLLWKRGELTVVDVGAGQLWVDGEPVNHSQVIESARIVFASAEIVVSRVPKREMPTAEEAAGIASRITNNS